MRRDIQEAQDPHLCKTLTKIRKSLPKPGEDAEAIIDSASDRAARFATRQTMVESKDRDPNGLERIIGKSDLCSINFLIRGLNAANSVARIRVREVDGSGEWFGTGFMVAPGLLLTNHHVLASEFQAALCLAEFNYQHDEYGVQLDARTYNLIPSKLFFTSSQFDFTLVEVAPRSLEGMPLAEFGYLPLIAASGKAIFGEWVSMIQHPGGQPKQISVRDSRVIPLSEEDIENIDADSFIHYTADSEPGSSGSPVFNDQWQVVALHHRSVPDFDKKGQRLARDGSVWTPEMGDEEKGWVANEGVRISAIYRALRVEQFESIDAQAALDRLTRGLAVGRESMLTVTGVGPSEVETEGQEADSKPTFFAGVQGYDETFLSKKIPLPTDKTRKKFQAKLTGSNSTRLDYTHFSVVFDTDRRFARFTAVNIDGSRLKQNKDLTKGWRRDGRIDVERQCDDNFYKTSIAKEVVVFQRGHLVRRVDPSWGTPAESKRAVEDTFHFTNAAPHVGEFNDTIWGNLEDYLLEKCDRTRKLMTVFSGPIFRKSDPDTYGKKRPGGPFIVPVDYWKVAVIQKTSTTIAAAGFIIGHGDLLDKLLAEELVFDGLHPFTAQQLVSEGIQTTIKTIEKETGLKFGDLSKFDSAAGLESTLRAKRLRTFSDIII